MKPHAFALLGVALCAALTVAYFVALVLRFAAEVSHI